MTIKLPHIINDYIVASNAHDVNSILDCFSNTAIVHDESETLEGKKAVEDWVVKTIKKYKFHFQPLNTHGNAGKITVEIKVWGHSTGAPVTLDYHFVIEGGKIDSLTID